MELVIVLMYVICLLDVGPFDSMMNPSQEKEDDEIII